MNKLIYDLALGRVVEVDASDPRPAIVSPGAAGQRPSITLEAFPLGVELEAAPANGGPQSYRFSVLQDVEIRRVDPWTGEIYFLSFAVTPGAVHADRAAGGSLRKSHFGDQIGSSRAAEFGQADGKDTMWLSGCRFLSGPEAQEIEAGIQPQGKEPPILQNVSVQIFPLRIEETPATETSPRKVRVLEGEYIHTAFVPDPAIPTVGPGRTLNNSEASAAPVRALGLTTREEEQPMKKVFDVTLGRVVDVPESDPRPALTAVELAAIETRAGGPAPTTKRDLAAERHEIELLAEEAGLLNDAEGRTKVREWIGLEYTPDRVGREIYQLQRSRLVRDPGPEQLVELSAAEAREYRCSRAILMQAGIIPKAGLEWRVHQALAVKFPNARGILIPSRLGPERLSNSDTMTVPGRGAELVQAGPIEFMDMLRNAPACAKMGATVLTVNNIGSIPFVRQTQGAIAQCVATGKKGTRGTLKFQIQEATPHRCVASNDYPIELLRTASISVDEKWKRDVINAHAPAWDYYALYGAGGAEPLGLMKMSGVQTVDFTDKVPTSILLRSCVSKVRAKNALTGNLGYLMHGELADVLSETPKVAGTNDYILKPAPGGDEEEFRFGNYRARATNQMGMTGSDYDGAFGPWQLLNMINFGVLEVTTNPFEKDEEGVVKVVSAAFIDDVCEMPEAFVKFDGARLTG